MKKHFFFSMLAAAAMLASCSSEDAAESNSLLSNGEGYVSLAINLPTVASNSTRAVNDIFDDGTANEYAVYDATLVLFKGTTEANAVVASSYSLNPDFKDETETDNITSTAQIVQKIQGSLGSGENYYALVVLNSKGQFVVNSDHELSVNLKPITGSGWTLSKFITETKIAMADGKIVTGNGADANTFFMSNAPLYTSIGGSTLPTGDVQTLPEIKSTNIYTTEAEAKAHPAATINVERAVAKVTLTAGDGKTTVNNLNYEIAGWQLDNTNTESYLVRKVDGYKANWSTLFSNANPADKYRFVGANEVGSSSGLYRTYWCVDPNYTSAMTDADKVRGYYSTGGVKYWDEDDTDAPAFVDAKGSASPLYCAENTFDVNHMNDINTTAAIIRVKFNAGATFYTVNKDETTLYTATSIIDYIKSIFLGNAAIKSALTSEIKPSETLGASDINVELSSASTVAGITTVKEITITSTDKLVHGTAIKASEFAVSGTTKALELINTPNTIRCYVGGMAYYAVKIKHFGDELTPWNTTETDKPTAGNIYPSTNATANYLGRYGLVRNNWYDISVTSIKNIGSPTVPTLGNSSVTPPDDPDVPGDGGEDDDMDQYISVKINVLSWAKRTQSVTL